jgi:PAS domain S-box-containing protein
MSDTKRVSASRWTQIGLFGVIAVTLAAGGYWFYRYEAQAIRTEKYDDLKAIAGLKTNQVVRWRRERIADARLNSSGPFLQSAINRWLENPNDADVKAGILMRLQLVRDLIGYQNVVLAGTDGRLLHTLDPRLTELDANAKQLVAQAVSSREAAFGDFFRCPDCKQVHLDVAASILDADNRPAAVLILRSDPEDYLYPLIQSWPTPSRSAETLLVRKDGDDLLFLNGLRHSAAPALTLRIPMSQADLPAAQAVLGKIGEFEGQDYRGVKVLADIRPVPDSPWFMVTKVDADELLAEARYRGGVILLLVVLAILVTGLMAAFVFDYRQRNLYRRLFRAERERREAQEEIRATLYGIGDGVLATDAAGRVTRMNPVAEQLTRWSEAEALGQPLEHVFRILNEDTRSEVENPVERVLREGVVVGLANHSLLIARDGTERPIADCGAPIRNEKGEIIGVAVVFRDQTEERQHQAALRKSETLYRSLVEHLPQRIFIKDRNSVYLSCNANFAQDLGLVPEQIVGKDDFAFHPRELAEKYRADDQAVMAAGTLKDIEERYQVAGEERWVHTFKVPYHDEQGRVIGVLGIFEDITARKRAEEASRVHRERLRSLASELSLTEERERQRIATYLHDQIAQVLVVLRLKVSQLEADAGSTDFPKKIQEIRDLTQHVVEDMYSVTFDLSPPILYELGLVPAIEWLGEKVCEVEGLRFEVIDDAQPKPMANGLRGTLFRAVRELLVNVVKHARAAHVTVTLRREENVVRIAVEDDGIGFVASGVTDRPRKEGGFGLFNVRERLEYLGGRMEMESQPGQGTRITLYAPLGVQGHGSGEVHHENENRTG